MEGATSSPANTRIAVVTGGNKGIGLEVCRQLAGDGVTVVLAARDETRGAEAAEKLNKLGHTDVVFHHLEVNNAAIVGVEYDAVPDEEKFSGMDRSQRTEWLLRHSRESYHAAKECLDTNYYGTKHVTEALLPLLRSSSDGRIVNVSSNIGLLRLFSNEELKQELNGIDDLTEARLDELLDMFLRDLDDGAVAARGWPTGFSAYKVSKAMTNAYTRILARRHPELRINCAHPGYVKTDLTSNLGFLTPEEGARNVVKVALLPDGGPTGAYFHEGQQEDSFV